MAKKAVAKETVGIRASRPRVPRSSATRAPAMPPAAPKIRALADRTSQLVELAFQKAAAHNHRPKKHPLPSDPACFERQALALFESLPLLQRRAAKKYFLDGADAGTAKRKQRFADLAQIDLESATSVADQARRLPVPAAVRVTAQDAEAIRRSFAPIMRPVAARQGRALAPQTMTARIVSLQCLAPSKQLELGKDEIVVSATVVDDLGNTSAVGEIDFGKFEEGQMDTVPRNVFTFNLAGGAFPKSFSVFYRVKETDLGESDAFFQGTMKMLAGAALFLVGLAAGIAIPGIGGAIVFGVLLAAGSTALGVGMSQMKILVSPRGGEPSVTFNTAGEVSFLDAAGNPSLVSQPVESDQEVSKGRYRLTTEFVLA